MRKKNKEQYHYGGNVCPPAPPTATQQELADAADQFSDLMDQALTLLEQAKRLVISYDVEACTNTNSRWADHYPKFPMSGSGLLHEIITAQASIIEANRSVAVQGYSAKRNLERSNDEQ